LAQCQYLYFLTPGNAAESICFILFLERSISVDALETYAKEGKLDSCSCLRPVSLVFSPVAGGLCQRANLSAVAILEVLIHASRRNVTATIGTSADSN